MPFRVGKDWPDRVKIQFTTGNWMPALIYRACLAAGVASNTVYCQRAVCEALARDLHLDLDDLLARLPPPRNGSAHLFNPDEHTLDRYRAITEDHTGGRAMIGPANTIEDVV